MKRIIAALTICLVAFSSSAWAGVCDILETANPPLATPFSCHGQTLIPSSGDYSNPAPNPPQLMAGTECPAIPYIVPAGLTLIVESMHLEGSGYGSGMYLWTGTVTTGYPSNVVLDSLESKEADPATRTGTNWQASNQYNDLNWWFAPGTHINVDVNDAKPVVTSWSFTGCLMNSIPVFPQAAKVGAARAAVSKGSGIADHQNRPR